MKLFFIFKTTCFWSRRISLVIALHPQKEKMENPAQIQLALMNKSPDKALLQNKKTVPAARALNAQETKEMKTAQRDTVTAQAEA